jgi:hypothetical protein
VAGAAVPARPAARSQAAVGRAQIASMKDYVARFGHGSAKLARQAQSKEKVLAKMVRGGLTERVKADHVVRRPPNS